MRRFNLVQKISLVLVAAALLGGLAISLLQYSTIDKFEHLLLDQSANNQLNAWIQLVRYKPAAEWNPGPGQHLYHFTETTRDRLPDGLRLLGAGRYHAVDIQGQSFDVTIRQEKGEFFALAQDINELEFAEDIAGVSYIAGMLAVVLIMFGLVYWVARRAVNPVVNLAAQLQTLQPDDPYVPMADRYEGDEAVVIARALDGFRFKLSEFVERERTFTAAASHELRTPLAVIASSNEILKVQPELGPIARQLSQRIERSAGQMDDMITSLLFLARDGGKGALLNQRQINASLLVREVVADHQALIQNQPLALNVLVTDSVNLTVEESHLRMILNNLLRNAVSHTPSGKVDVELSPNLLVVRDNGAGIEPDLLKRVFQRDVADARSHGLGFGLYLCKQLCNRYGWTLEIASAPGQGTCVQIEF